MKDHQLVLVVDCEHPQAAEELAVLLAQCAEDNYDCEVAGFMVDPSNPPLRSLLRPTKAQDERPQYLQEFPNFDCDLRGHFPKEQGWEDTSWHNDTCPSFHLRSKMVSVYVDYLDPEKRESGDESADRFTFVQTNPRGEYPSDGSGPYRSCNTWDEVTEVLSGLRSYSEEQLGRIEQLADGIEDSHIKMAVVDYLGKRDADGLVPEDDLDRRFGVRDLRHVEIYGLHVVLLNRKARQAG